MTSHQQSIPARRRYATIDANLRLALIDRVELEDYTVAVAAEQMGIKLSTAKLILKRFRRTGTVFMRRRERTEPQRPQRQKKNKKKEEPPKQLSESKESEERKAPITPVSNPDTLLTDVVACPWVWVYEWPQIDPLYAWFPCPQ